MLTERQFARLVGSSLSVVQERRKAGRLPRSSTQDAKGHWQVDPVVGRVEWEAFAPLHAGAGKNGEGHQAWREARTRREAALATLAEDEVRRSRGELVLAADVEARLVNAIMLCKTKLLGIPARMKERCPHLVLADLAELERLIREALEDLAGGAACAEPPGPARTPKARRPGRAP